jgi:hypothetical protein
MNESLKNAVKSVDLAALIRAILDSNSVIAFIGLNISESPAI